MVSNIISFSKVVFSEHEELLEISYQTFYDAFGPPTNSEEDIQIYLRQKITSEQIKNELSNPNSTFYFAKIDDIIVGYLKLNKNKAQTELIKGNALEIERIYVYKKYQGNAIGQLLLEKSIQIGKSERKDFIWLGVWNQNTRAIKFYKKHGFTIFDTHQFKLGKEIQTDIMMKRML